MSVADAWASLEADLLGDEPDLDTDPATVELPDATAADRLLGRIARIDRALVTDREVADAQIRKVEDWLDARKAAASRERDWLRSVLARYHQAVLARDPKRKTITLPNGTLTCRAQQPEWLFDEETFVAWANRNLPDAVRYPPTPAPEVDKPAAKALLTLRDEKGRAVKHGVTPDGEAAPGVVVNERLPKFDVEIGDFS